MNPKENLIEAFVDQVEIILGKEERKVRESREEFLQSCFVTSDDQEGKCSLSSLKLIRVDPRFESAALRFREWTRTGDREGIYNYGRVLFLDGQYVAGLKLLWILFENNYVPATYLLADFFINAFPNEGLE